MNFADVKSIAIPEGDVKSIAVGGVTVWEKLPYDAEVEYVESTGTQYIDTGHIPTNDVEVRGHFSGVEYPSSTDVGILFGSRTDKPFRFCSINLYSNRSQIYFGGASAVATLYGTPSEFDLVLNRTTATIGSASASFSASLATGTNPIFIFRRSAPDGVSALPVLRARLHSFSIYEVGTPVRDFVPVRVGSTGYLLDRVSGQLFGNAGTGDFTLGPDK